MVKIAVLGFGTVGAGVVDVIYDNADIVAKNAADKIEVEYILDIRDYPDSPFAGKVIHDFETIINDDSISVVVETIGGTKPAYEFTKRSLLAGKSVVTSNKELVATHGAELIKIAKENNVNYLFEAAVGGGIPIIRPMAQCLAANRIDEVCGILNGTTNYILNRMINAGLSFEKALAEAQEKGYAERNPAADVEGHDACRKICILAALAFGRHVYPEYVKTEGITKITLEDVAYAESDDKVIKLLGRARRVDDKGRAYVFVAPHLVSRESPLACVNGVFNSIMVSGNQVDDVMFYGRGAGKYPTASAVVADVIDAAKHLNARKYLSWDDGDASCVADLSEFKSKYYVRVSGDNARSAAIDTFGEVKFLSCADADSNECAFITDEMTVSELNAKLEKIKNHVALLSNMMVL
ncbi:MAG: homoserine dehydrogenase [Clostridia bacterium]|nr:homoserine dehydrogenase [Clostridia bacterium]